MTKNKITVLIILHPKPRLNFKYFRATSCLLRTRNVAERERGATGTNKAGPYIHQRMSPQHCHILMGPECPRPF